MVLNHNIVAMNASRMEGINGIQLQKVMEKLSSGERINRSSDDAAGLSISEKMRAQIRGLNQASKNTTDGISFVQTVEGHLSETTEILQRIRELAVQSANGIYTAEDRASLNVEVSQLIAEVDRIASQAQFNGMNVLSGRFAENAMVLHVGANMDQNIAIKINDMSATALGLKNGEDHITLETQEESNIVIGTIDEALKKVNKQRSDLGGFQSRLELSKKGIDIASENLTASESRIRDTDFAKESVELAKNKILEDMATSMIAQGNVLSQNVLELFR